MPRRPAFSTRRIWTSPVRAYSRMLRAISETAAAMTVRSLEEKSSCDASRFPSCRARTMSESVAIATRTSPSSTLTPLAAVVEIGETFFEIERRRHAGEGQAELHHGERHFGL